MMEKKSSFNKAHLDFHLQFTFKEPSVSLEEILFKLWAFNYGSIKKKAW